VDGIAEFGFTFSISKENLQPVGAILFSLKQSIQVELDRHFFGQWNS
jgi:hypothetical protein